MRKIDMLPICGFPGVGKTRLSKMMGYNDSDSSRFSWTESKVRHPEWPRNYIEHLNSLKGIALVSTHTEVRDALADAGIPFVLCYPERGCKGEYLERYRKRGSSEKFVAIIADVWDNWIAGLDADGRAAMRVVLKPGMFIADVEWGNILSPENLGFEF